MTSTVGARKTRNPWWVVVGAGLLALIDPGPTVLATLGVFLLPIVDQTGLSRTAVTTAYSFSSVSMAVGVILVGYLLDRYAIRYIMIPGAVGIALSIFSMSVIPMTPGIHLIPWIFLGFFAAGLLIPISKALVSWFDNKRGVAIGIRTGMAGVGNAIWPIIAGALIVNLGWQGAYAAIGLITLVIGVGAISLFIRVRAERHVHGRLLREAVQNGEQVSLELPGLTYGEALRSRYFWMICFGLGLVGIVNSGLTITIVPMMSDQGMPVEQAVVLLTILGLASATGRLGGGFLLDRFRATIIGPIVIIAPVAGLFLLHPPFGSAAAAVALIGLALGIEGDMAPFLITRYLGMRAFGKIYGTLTSIFILGTGFGPLLLAFGWDSYGSYDPVFPVLGGILVFCAIVIGLLGKYKYPAIKNFDKVAEKDELASAGVLSEIAETEEAVDPKRAKSTEREKSVTAGNDRGD